MHVLLKESDTFFVTDISIPPAIKKRGRPKGHELTTIGVPRKRTKTMSKTKVKLQPFIKLHTSVKQRGSYNYEGHAASLCRGGGGGGGALLFLVCFNPVRNRSKIVICRLRGYPFLRGSLLEVPLMIAW